MKKFLITLSAIAIVGVIAVYGYSISDARLQAEANTSQKPNAQTLAATDVTTTSAMLHGTYNNNGGYGGHVWFEYGTNSSGQGFNDRRVNLHYLAEGSSGLVNENFSLTNLQPNVQYYYRFVIRNGSGEEYGTIQGFKTLPLGDASCVPDPKAHIEYTIDYRAEGWTTASATMKNKSTNCTYKVGMASYKTFAANRISDQVLFHSDSKTLAPGETVSLQVNLPSCTAQVDLFEGEVSTGPNGPWYDSHRLFAGPWVNHNLGYCGNTTYTGTLKIVKTVTNDNGGTKQVSDFKLYQNGTQVTSGEVKTYTFVGPNDNKILTMTEDNLSGYTASAWGGDCAADGKITLRPGDNKTCTINNNDNPPVNTCPNASGKLTLEETKTAIHNGTLKIVLLNNATENKAISTIENNTNCAVPLSQVTYKMFDTQLGTQEMFDYAPAVNTALTIPAHSTSTLKTNLPPCMAQTDLYYDVGPTQLFNDNRYGNITLKWVFWQNNGSSYGNASGNFCSHTPDPATLKVVKTVVNDNGGTKQVSDFKLYQNNVQVTSGEVKTYTFTNTSSSTVVTVKEDNLSGYTASAWGGDCAADGKITLRPGDNKTCTITNNDNPPATATLKLVKVVINDNGGTKTATDFPLFVNTQQVTHNQAVTLTPGQYTASEQNQTGYTAGTWTGDCAADGKVTLNAGDNKVCTITNNDIPPVVQKGCIAITKEAYTYNDVRITSNIPTFTFKLDNNQTYTSDANGTVTINDVTVGTHTLAEVVPSGWTLFSVVPANQNGTIDVPAGSNCAQITFKNKQVPPTLTGTCVANKNPALLNETVTYTANPVGGSGSYTYTWSGTDSLTGNATSTQKAYSTTGTKNAHVIITSGSQSVTADCSTVINQPSSNFGLTCSANASTVFIGTPVTYTANATGGTGTYTYSWTGTHDLTGSASTTVKTYNEVGQKTATVTVTSGSESLSAQCNVQVVQQTFCGNCGGSTPSVTVTRETTPGQVAGVFLSQIPYTGVGSNLKIALFMLGLFTWSAWISYLIIKRKAKKHGLTVSQVFQGVRVTPALAYAGASTMIDKNPTPTTASQVAAMKEKMATAPVRSPFVPQPAAPKAPAPEPYIPNLPTNADAEKQFTKPVEPKAATKYEPAFTPRKPDTQLVTQSSKPKAEITLPSSTQDILETLEMRARELQTLVSADGLEVIVKASNNNKHNATIILNHLVELYKGSEHEVDGDWMILNSEKINKILFSTYITMTPVFIQWLSIGDDRKVMSFVRMLQMQGQAVKDFVMNVVIELDKAYRYRIENAGDVDGQILDATMQWTNQELESVIHTLVTAVDQTYSSIYASVKIALVKVIDMAKGKLQN